MSPRAPFRARPSGGPATAAGDGLGASRPASWKAHHVAVLYVLFALLSVGVNLGVQQIAVVGLTGRTGAVLPLSMLCGTGAGFVAKYVLDKKFIFFDVSAGHRDEARKVALYGIFGLFTTALFWGTEAAFFGLFGTAAAKYAGAVLGLGLGYALKFALDRRFTFTGPGGV